MIYSCFNSYSCDNVWPRQTEPLINGAISGDVQMVYITSTPMFSMLPQQILRSFPTIHVVGNKKTFI